MKLTSSQLEALRAIAVQSPSLVAYCDINGVDIDEAIVAISKRLIGDETSGEHIETIVQIWIEDEWGM
jgi:hypothetical protein